MRIIDLIRTDFALYGLLIIWVFISALFNPFAYLLLPTVFILVHREKYFEVIVTLLLVLILSDNSNLIFSWVKSFKTIFMLILFITWTVNVLAYLSRLCIKILCISYSSFVILG